MFLQFTSIVTWLRERKRTRVLRRMQSDWDARAKKNARYYIATGKADWTDEEFFASGEQAVTDDILTDLDNICQGKDPATMRMLEIGCGAGRMTRALAGLFGEVHAVDISGEMITRAQAAVAGKSNVFLYQNNGCDLTVVPSPEFDFAYSSIVFQHIPSRQVIESYVCEVNRLLRPGALFKFQLQGIPGRSRYIDTWRGVSFTAQQTRSMAERNGFEARYSSGANTQYFWQWFFKESLPPGVQKKPANSAN